MNEHNPPVRTVRLFRDGPDQAIRIPEEFALPGTEALIRKDGDRLIIEAQAAPQAKPPMREFLESLEAFPDFADIDHSDLPPLRDIDLE